MMIFYPGWYLKIVVLKRELQEVSVSGGSTVINLTTTQPLIAVSSRTVVLYVSTIAPWCLKNLLKNLKPCWLRRDESRRSLLARSNLDVQTLARFVRRGNTLKSMMWKCPQGMCRTWLIFGRICLLWGRNLSSGYIAKCDPKFSSWKKLFLNIAKNIKDAVVLGWDREILENLS